MMIVCSDCETLLFDECPVCALRANMDIISQALERRYDEIDALKQELENLKKENDRDDCIVE